MLGLATSLLDLTIDQGPGGVRLRKSSGSLSRKYSNEQISDLFQVGCNFAGKCRRCF